MKTQSLEFITGYLFCDSERMLIKRIHGNDTVQKVECTVQIPKCWFGVPANSNRDIDIEDKIYVKSSTVNKLSPIFFKWDINVQDELDRQYIKFTFIATKKKKKMTITEIEEALGYPIEIVEEHKDEDKH